MDNKENQFPAQLKGQERVDAVIENARQNRAGVTEGTFTTPTIDKQEDLRQQTGVNLTQAEQASQAALQNSRETVTNTATKEKSFFGLGGLFSKEKRAEDIKQADARAQAAFSDLESAKAADLDQQVVLNQVKAQEVARQTEVIKSNELGGPMEAPGAEIFSRQDILAARGKAIEQSALFYSEHVKQITDREVMIPMDQIDSIKSTLIRVSKGESLASARKTVTVYQEQLDARTKKLEADGQSVEEDYNVKQLRDRLKSSQESEAYQLALADKEANEKIREVAILYESAIKYADENNIPVNQDLLIEAVKKGTLLAANRFMSQENGGPSKTKRHYLDYIRETVGVEPTWQMKDGVDPYSFSAFLLKGFAEKNNLPQDETLVPYMIAFIAGCRGQYDRPEETLQKLLVDVLPVKTLVQDRVGKSWVDREIDKKGDGLGSQIQVARWDNRYLGDTTTSVINGELTDQGLRFAVAQAKKTIEMLSSKFGTGRAGITGWNSRYPQGWNS